MSPKLILGAFVWEGRCRILRAISSLKSLRPWLLAFAPRLFNHSGSAVLSYFQGLFVHTHSKGKSYEKIPCLFMDSAASSFVQRLEGKGGCLQPEQMGS